MIFLNPPSGRSKPKVHFTKKRLPPRKRKRPTARKTTRKKATRKTTAARKKTRSNPRSKPVARKTKRRLPPRIKSGKNKGQFRKRAGAKRTTRRKTTRRRKTTAKRRPATRRRRRSTTARRKTSTRRRRSPAQRRRYGRRLGGRKVRYRSHRGITRKWGVRAGAKKWRKRKKYVRSNPKFLPSFREVKGFVRDGAYVGVGWVGVNATMMLLNKAGVGKVTGMLGSDPKIQAAANFVLRLLTIPLVGYVAGRTLGANARSKAILGASFNAVFHGVQDVVANTSALPSWGSDLLLGYDGVNDYVAVPYGMGNYVGQNVSSQMRMAAVEPLPY